MEGQFNIAKLRSLHKFYDIISWILEFSKIGFKFIEKIEQLWTRSLIDLKAIMENKYFI